MNLIQDLRDRLLRKKPTAGGQARGTQAQKLAERMTESPAPTPSPPPKPEPPARGPERARADLDQLLGEIDNRLGAQRAETERLIKPIEGLPEAVEAITEVKTQCGRMLKLISSQVQGTRDQEQALDATFGSLRDASSHHAEVLAGIRERVEANTQAIQGAAESYDHVTESINEVLKACCKLQETLNAMAHAGEDKTGQVARMLARSERAFKLVAIGAGAAGAVALLLGIIALVT